jgi:hypothetical protein
LCLSNEVPGELQNKFGLSPENIECKPLELKISETALLFFEQLKRQLTPQELQDLTARAALHKKMTTEMVLAFFNEFILRQECSSPIPAIPKFLSAWCVEMEKATVHVTDDYQEILEWVVHFNNVFFPGMVQKTADNIVLAVFAEPDFLKALPSGRERWFQVNKGISLLGDLLEACEILEANLQRCLLRLRAYQAQVEKIQACCAGISEADLTALQIFTLSSKIPPYKKLLKKISTGAMKRIEPVRLVVQNHALKLDAFIAYKEQLSLSRAIGPPFFRLPARWLGLRE